MMGQELNSDLVKEQLQILKQKQLQLKMMQRKLELLELVDSSDLLPLKVECAPDDVLNNGKEEVLEDLNEIERGEQRLMEQGLELDKLRQELLELQDLKSRLIERKEHAGSGAEEMESLNLNDQPDLLDFEESNNIIPTSNNPVSNDVDVDQPNDVDQPVINNSNDFELDDTRLEIQQAIDHLSIQLLGIKQQENNIESREEQEYFEFAVREVEGQLVKLFELRDKAESCGKVLKGLEDQKESGSPETINAEQRSIEGTIIEPRLVETVLVGDEFRVPSTTPFTTLKQHQTDRSQKLFHKYRDNIYKQSNNLIETFQHKPSFLLNLFKGLIKLRGDDRALEEVLMFLEELLEQGEMDREAEELNNLGRGESKEYDGFADSNNKKDRKDGRLVAELHVYDYN